MKCLYFGVKISVLLKLNRFFNNLSGKVVKIYSFCLSCFKFDAVYFNLHKLGQKETSHIKHTFYMGVFHQSLANNLSQFER